MGKIRTYNCKCGYTEQIFEGVGMRAKNIKGIEHLFPQIAKEIAEGNVESYILGNVMAECKTCKKLCTAAYLKYTLSGMDNEMTIRQNCPNCGGKTDLTNNIDSINCPKCGTIMEYKMTGHWD